ncbi:uncharacterized protein LOC134326990 isoform X2 [Trichomycterus rosablanca]|uniref:uncharacterized protein LOC134305926 isoform X2 n=1 Tax=Trichomycterus rosablanca TaxID=2290929 RepID=UPI002F35E889
MKAFLSHLSAGLSEVNLRPLLFVAGAATATAGAYYLYKRFTGGRRGEVKEDAGVQTDPGPEGYGGGNTHTNVLDSHTDGVHTDEQISDPYQINPQHHREVQRSHLTLRLSYSRWHDRHTAMIRVRRHYTLQIRGAVSQSWWVLTNDFYKATDEGLRCFCSAHRVTLAVHIDGCLARVASYIFTKRHATVSSWGVQAEDTFWSSQGVLISDNRCVVTVPCGSEVVLYNPEPRAPHQPEETSRPQTSPEVDVESGHIEIRNVPALFHYCRMKGIKNFTHKLAALRQAFNIVFSHPPNYSYICVVGRMTLLVLVAAKKRDLRVFQRRYDRLIQMLENRTNRMWAEVELTQIGIQHVNFMDIVFELVLLGILGRARVHQIISLTQYRRRRLFLNRLIALIFSCVTPRWIERQETERYLFHLQTEMLSFLDEIFTLDESLYAEPEALATALETLLWQSLRRFHERLETDDI